MIADGRVGVLFIGGPLEGQMLQLPAQWIEHPSPGRWQPPSQHVVEEMRSPVISRRDPLASCGEMRVWTVTYRIEWDDARAHHIGVLQTRKERT